nr:unnamed protein product [Digitaria exilis]
MHYEHEHAAPRLSAVSQKTSTRPVRILHVFHLVFVLSFSRLHWLADLQLQVRYAGAGAQQWVVNREDARVRVAALRRKWKGKGALAASPRSQCGDNAAERREWTRGDREDKPWHGEAYAACKKGNARSLFRARGKGNSRQICCCSFLSTIILYAAAPRGTVACMDSCVRPREVLDACHVSRKILAVSLRPDRDRPFPKRAGRQMLTGRYASYVRGGRPAVHAMPPLYVLPVTWRRSIAGRRQLHTEQYMYAGAGIKGQYPTHSTTTGRGH